MTPCWESSVWCLLTVKIKDVILLYVIKAKYMCFHHAVKVLQGKFTASDSVKSENIYRNLANYNEHSGIDWIRRGLELCSPSWRLFAVFPPAPLISPPIPPTIPRLRTMLGFCVPLGLLLGFWFCWGCHCASVSCSGCCSTAWSYYGYRPLCPP